MKQYFDPLKGQAHERMLFDKMPLKNYVFDRAKRGLRTLTEDELLMLKVERIECWAFRPVPADPASRDRELSEEHHPMNTATEQKDPMHLWTVRGQTPVGLRIHCTTTYPNGGLDGYTIHVLETAAKTMEKMEAEIAELRVALNETKQAKLEFA